MGRLVVKLAEQRNNTSMRQKPRNSATPKVPKVLIAPVEISGYYKSLSYGFKELGVNCDFVTYKDHPYLYGGETANPALLRLAKVIDIGLSQKRRHLIARTLGATLSLALKNVWGFAAMFRYDVFIFGFGRSLMSKNFDLKLLQLLKKTVIVNVGHGTEARPPYISGVYQSQDGRKQPTPNLLKRESERIKRRISYIEKNCTYLICAPLTSQFLTKEFINWFSVGVPTQIETDLPVGESEIGRCEQNITRILHAPSRPALKGTFEIEKAVRRLQDKGYRIHLKVIQDMDNAAVIQAIDNCDFIVDQIYSDTPMAGLATEAAQRGKPSIVGGYGWKSLENYVLPENWPPSKLCSPFEVYDAIEFFIKNPGEVNRLGKESREFVRKRWSSRVVAERYLCIINGRAPRHWWLNPKSISYLSGVGQSIERSNNNMLSLLNLFGIGCLQLEHRPDLETIIRKIDSRERKNV